MRANLLILEFMSEQFDIMIDPLLKIPDGPLKTTVYLFIVILDLLQQLGYFTPWSTS